MNTVPAVSLNDSLVHRCDSLLNVVQQQSLAIQSIETDRNVIIVIFLVLLLLKFFLIFKLVRLLKAEISNYMVALTEVQHELSEKNTHNELQTQQIHQLFKGQFKTINALINVYYQEETTEQRKKDIYREVKQQVSKLVEDKKSYKELEQLVNKYNDNIISRLRAETELSEETYQLLCYHIAGFSVNAISIFFNVKPITIYKRLAKAKATISNVDTPHKKEFLEAIS